MGFGSFIKKVGRAVDPTSKSSPLGGLARTAIGFVPGGNAAMLAVQGVKAATDRSSPTARTQAPPQNTGSVALPEQNPTPSAGSPPLTSQAGIARLASWVNKPAVLVGAGLSVVALVVALILGRRK